MLSVNVASSEQSFTLDLNKLDVEVLKANKDVVEDMTALRHLNLPAILYNIRERALHDEPYTFLGNSVLVAVNPLKFIPDPVGALGSSDALKCPHPYAIAEVAFQQMKFGAGRREDRRDTPVNQSILVSGESGAGKTESSKMVLRHLVHRCVSDYDEGPTSHMDRRLLDSNPILEAFGNAATKRNHNSSRFGKFLKLHFAKTMTNKKTKLKICGASIETYLLERSRVTLHGEGERTYHVFYMFLAGATNEHREAFELDQQFILTKPRKRPADLPLPRKTTKSLRVSLDRLESNDKRSFRELCASLSTFDIPEKSDEDGLISQWDIFSILAAMLHLGNLRFVNDEDTSEGYVALIENTDPLEKASELLGVEEGYLRSVITERKVITSREEIITRRDAHSAKDATDALIKSLYVQLFEWIAKHLSEKLSGEMASKDETFFIGVLDIFGFEVFSVNDFEQLLINFTNEALQSSFKKQVLEAELELYASEGLQLPDDIDLYLSDDSPCMDLLRGANKRDPGILGTIDNEGRQPQPLDEKMCAHLHREFKGHPKFPAPHPLDQRTTFKILHFAGEVKYTVGSFLEKNSDRMPAEMNDLFKSSSHSLVNELFCDGSDDQSRNSTDRAAVRAGQNVRKLTTTIISRFREQMDMLLATLSGTRCSYIRCIKPNPLMIRETEGDEEESEEEKAKRWSKRDLLAKERAEREGDSGDWTEDSWFDGPFVAVQLENLGILETTKVLQMGFPTRVPFDVFVSSYKGLMPPEVLDVWRTIGGGHDRAFIKALFFAFHIEPTTYKLGLTKVFFRSGMLDQLGQVLDAAVEDVLDEEIVHRFRHSFARQLWRNLLAKISAAKEFEHLLMFCRKRNSASTIIQRLARRKRAELEAKAELARQRELKQKREQEEKKEQARLAAKREAEAKKAAAEAEAKKLREAAELKARAELESEMRRVAEEAAQKAAAEQAQAREYRLQAEKEEREARKREKAETKRTIAELGGEEAFRKQIEHEKSVSFSGAVKVQEFPKYFSDEHAMPVDLRAARKRAFEKPIVGDDLDDIAPTVRVVLSPESAAPLPSVEEELVHRKPRDSLARPNKPKRASISQTIKRVSSRLRRRSYAPTMADAKTDEEAARAKFALLRQGIPETALTKSGAALDLKRLACPAVEYCVDKGPARGERSFMSSSRGARSLFCLVNRKKHDDDDEPDTAQEDVPGHVILTSSGPRYSFAPCFVSVEGFELAYFESAKDDHNEMVGVTEIGRVHVGNIADIIRFNSGSTERKLDGVANISRALRLRVRDVLGYKLVLLFPDENMCTRVANHLERATNLWKAEAAALKQMGRGELRESVKVDEAKELFDSGRISSKAYKEAMLHQLSSETEYAQMQVAMFGEDGYDKRVQCPSCGAVNFLVEAGEDGEYKCHVCKDVLELPGAGDAHHRKSRINSTVFDKLDAEELSSIPPPPSFPITVQLADKSSLTVFEVDLLPHPRRYEKTQSRMYFYTFRCQYVEPIQDKNKDNVHHWFVDQPFEAFENLHNGLLGYAKEWGKELELPDFTDVEPQKTERDTAELRLNCLNDYMEEFLEAAKTQDFIFQAPPVRIFFNLRALKIAPLAPEELEDLRPAMEALDAFQRERKKWSQEIYELFINIVDIEPRLEATADADTVFNSIEHSIARLTYEQKSEVFRTGQRYMSILDSVNAHIERLLAALPP